MIVEVAQKIKRQWQNFIILSQQSTNLQYIAQVEIRVLSAAIRLEQK